MTEKKEDKVINLIPLKGIKYRAVISGIQAVVRTIQKYENKSKESIEVVYVFPLPDEASVIGCRMVIGKKKIIANIKEREEAKKEYSEAISSGNYGTLMEQERPNIFTMNVGGIEPGEKVEVEVDYVQRIPWQNNGGRFRIPLVVAPRFIPGKPIGESKGHGWSPDTDEVPDASRITPPVAKEGVPYNAEINISFTSGFDCQTASPSHPILVKGQKVTKRQTKEIKTGEIRTDRDFILVYESLSKVPVISSFHSKKDGEHFSLINIFPPAIAQEQPSDYILLLDRSGSMQGAKIAGLRTVTKKVLEKLQAQNVGHQAAVIAYNNTTELICPLGNIDKQTIEKVSQIESRGTTYLGRALTFAYTQFKDSARPKIILVVSDGQTEDTAYAGSGARIICVGIDAAVNDSTLKNLAGATGGTCVWCYPGEDFDRAANTIVGMLSGPVLQNISVDVKGDVLGKQDVFMSMPATIAIRHEGDLPEIVTIKGKNPEGKEEAWQVRTKDSLECDFTPQIWAREFIRENPDADKQTAVSLKYGVICKHTAFVATLEKKVPGKKPVRVDIPVNLPHTWDYDSVFGSTSTLLSAGLNFAGSGARRSFMPKSDAFMSFRDVHLDEVIISKSIGSSLKGIGGHGKGVLDMLVTVPAFSISDPSELIIVILEKAARGEDIEADCKMFKKLMTQKVVASWNVDKLCRTFYFLFRLSTYGYKLTEEGDMVILALGKKSNASARGAWTLVCKKETGYPFKLTSNIVFPAHDEGDYTKWKLGMGNKPVHGIWSAIP